MTTTVVGLVAAKSQYQTFAPPAHPKYDTAFPLFAVPLVKVGVPAAVAVTTAVASSSFASAGSVVTAFNVAASG
ncbi:hypothetical protein D3C86_1948750 [compost metagenome]